jgi:penicillin-binding protein 2
MASGLSFGAGRSVTAVKQTSKSTRAGRAGILLLLASGLLGIHAFRLAQLQIVQGAYNRQLAENNRVRPIPMIADRGMITDRNGKILAASQLSRSIYLFPRKQTPESWAITADRLGAVLNIPPEQILAKLAKIGYQSAVPVRIFQNLKEESFIALAEGEAIPGLEIQPESSRSYPNQSIAAHVLGYIGEATEADMKKHPEFPMGMLVGQMGLERIIDDQVRGRWGSRLIEVDARGQETRLLGTQTAVAGQATQLTLDYKLQETAERALNGRRGAAVVIDIKTGAVLALASAPTFDPNLFTRRVGQKEWDAMMNQEQPFLNRALQGYPPASTFKIVSSVAGLQSGKFEPNSTLMTAGALNIGGVLFHEHGGGGYGEIGFKEALTVSSNTFFYQVGVKVGPEEIYKWGHKLGIGETKLDLDGGSTGFIPTPDLKKKVYKEDWYTGDTVTMAIGQGLVQMTPLEMAVMVAAIANGGKQVKPHLLMSQTALPAMQPIDIGLKPSTIDVVRDGLIAVVKDGTAQQLSDGSIPPTAGKTGTAEVPGGADNAMYVGYGPVKDPRIAIAVVVEHGGFGAESAVPIAHAVYRTYFGAPAATKNAAQ